MTIEGDILAICALTTNPIMYVIVDAFERQVVGRRLAVIVGCGGKLLVGRKVVLREEAIDCFADGIGITRRCLALVLVPVVSLKSFVNTCIVLVPFLEVERDLGFRCAV